MFEDLDDNADWFTHIQRRIRAARNEGELKLISALMDGHEFLALPERVQNELNNQFMDRLDEVGANE